MEKYTWFVFPSIPFIFGSDSGPSLFPAPATMKFLTVAKTALLALTSSTFAQNVTVPTTCTSGFQAGSDEVLYTVPFNYTQVMPIIGSYKNLTWSGNKPNTVSLNGSDDTVGTARTYNLGGSHVIETILTYSKPPFPGPYQEVHNTALLTVPSAGNISIYIPYDGTVVSSVCEGKASTFNFTAHFCSDNATVAGQVLHMLHYGDAVTVGKFLGGENFTSCAALNATGTATNLPSGVASATASGTAPTTSASASVVPSTGGADRYTAGCIGAAISFLVAFAFL